MDDLREDLLGEDLLGEDLLGEDLLGVDDLLREDLLGEDLLGEDLLGVDDLLREDLLGEDLLGEDLLGVDDLLREDLLGEDLLGEDLLGEDLGDCWGRSAGKICWGKICWGWMTCCGKICWGWMTCGKICWEDLLGHRMNLGQDLLRLDLRKLHGGHLHWRDMQHLGAGFALPDGDHQERDGLGGAGRLDTGEPTVDCRRVGAPQDRAITFAQPRLGHGRFGVSYEIP